MLCWDREGPGSVRIIDLEEDVREWIYYGDSPNADMEEMEENR